MIYIKWVAGGLILASLFILVILGKMSAMDYQTLAVGVLGAIGGFHVGKFTSGDK